MKDKLKRFTILVYERVCSFIVIVWFLYGLALLTDTRIMICHVIVVLLLVALLVFIVAGWIFSLLEFIQNVRNRITKKAAAVLDPDELQE